MIIIFALLYFVPVVIALCRQHQNAFAIFLLNLFLGWTFIGWIASLVWACTRASCADVRVAPWANHWIAKLIALVIVAWALYYGLSTGHFFS